MRDRVLIVGLGNPGREHRQTRHNIGFMAIDSFVTKSNISIGKVQFKALIGEGMFEGVPIILAKPQTYMNLSGDSVGPLLNYYKIDLANMLVIYDDLDLDFGYVRLRPKGGAGGHNGMKSIIQHVGQQFNRLRLGIGRPPGRMPVAAYVLQKFGSSDAPLLETTLSETNELISCWVQTDIQTAMNRFNSKGGK